MYIKEFNGKSTLEITIKENKLTNITDLSREVQMSADQIIDLTCVNEIEKLRRDYGDVSVLSIIEAAEALKTVSETTLRRRKKRGLGEPPRYNQEEPGAKIYYPFREIAAEMYLEAHPVKYGEYSLARIIKSRHV